MVVDWELWFLFSSRRRHTICAVVTGVQTCALPISPDLIETNRLPIDPALLEQLLAKAAGADEVIVMTDPDQEGEVIAHDVARSLRQLQAERQPLEIGSASCRERGGQSV